MIQAKSDEVTTQDNAVHHKYASMFPMLDEVRLQELADDIKQNGLQQRIVIDDDDKILDGRNRAAACLIAGVEPDHEPFIGTDEEKLRYVISCNIHRRHLEPGQRAMIAAKLEVELAKVAKEREKKRKSKTTKATVPESKGQARDGAAKMMGVSGRSVSDAKLVKSKGTTEQIEAVTKGTAPVSTTAKAIRAGSKDVPAKKPKKKQAPAKQEPFPAAILKTCADGEYRSLEQIAAAAGCTEPEAKRAIAALKRDQQRHLVRQTNMTGGSDRHEKDRRYRILTSSGKRINLELVMDKLEPHLAEIESQGKSTSAAEYAPSVILTAAFHLRKELQELSTEADATTPSGAAPKLKPIADLIAERCLGLRTHRSVKEIAEVIDVAPGSRTLRKVLNQIQYENLNGLAAKTKTFAGGVTKYQFRKLKNEKNAQVRASTVADELSPLLKEVQEAFKNSNSHDVVGLIRPQFKRLSELMNRYT